ARRAIERRARPVGREDEEEEVVVEGLDRVVPGGHHQATPAGQEALAHLGEDGEEEPEDNHVADDPAHVRQAPAEDEEDGHAAPQGGDRDAPPDEEVAPGPPVRQGDGATTQEWVGREGPGTRHAADAAGRVSAPPRRAADRDPDRSGPRSPLPTRPGPCRSTRRPSGWPAPGSPR